MLLPPDASSSHHLHIVYLQTFTFTQCASIALYGISLCGFCIETNLGFWPHEVPIMKPPNEILQSMDMGFCYITSDQQRKPGIDKVAAVVIDFAVFSLTSGESQELIKWQL